jgi:hypothetical protein
MPIILRRAFGPVHSSVEIVPSFSSTAQTEPGDTHEAAWHEDQRWNKTFRLNTWSSDNMMRDHGGVTLRYIYLRCGCVLCEPISICEYIYPRCGEVLCAPINITKVDLVLRSAEKSR